MTRRKKKKKKRTKRKKKNRKKGKACEYINMMVKWGIGGREGGERGAEEQNSRKERTGTTENRTTTSRKIAIKICK